MKIAIFPASFDPITIAHMNIIQRASMLCDKLIVLVADNFNKKYMFSHEQRLAIVLRAIEELALTNVEVRSSNGLTVKQFIALNANFIIRGVRNYQDFEYEANLALINQDLYPTALAYEAQQSISIDNSSVDRTISIDNSSLINYLPKDKLETIYLASENHFKHISSSLVRELTHSPELFSLYAKKYLSPSTYQMCYNYLFNNVNNE